MGWRWVIGLRMNCSKAIRTSLAAGALCAAAFIIWPGCTFRPLAISRKPVSSLRPADFSFGNSAHPSRSDIVSKVGAPAEYFADLRIACYQLNRVRRRELCLLFGILPIAAPKEADRLEVAMIQFDNSDRAQRIEITIIPFYPADRNSFRYSARRWTTNSLKPAGKSPGH